MLEERKDPIFKSKRRHGLKMIERKWANRKVKAPEKALSNAGKALKLHKIMANKEHKENQVEKHFGSFEKRFDKFTKFKKK